MLMNSAVSNYTDIFHIRISLCCFKILLFSSCYAVTFFLDSPTREGLCKYTVLPTDEIKVGWPDKVAIVTFIRKYVEYSPNQRFLPNITASVNSHTIPIECQSETSCSCQVEGEYIKQNEQVTLTTRLGDSEVTCDSYIALRYEGELWLN